MSSAFIIRVNYAITTIGPEKYKFGALKRLNEGNWSEK
jgi:hypothetical protein